MDNDVLNVLITARNLIAKPENWCQGVFMDETDDGTISYCARGAIYASLQSDPYNKDSSSDWPYCQELIQAVPSTWLGKYKSINSADAVAGYNNSQEHQDVLALFDDTIARLKREKTINELMPTNTASELETA